MRPDWLVDLVERLAMAAPDHFQRFELPEGKGARQSAVLLLFAHGDDGIELVVTRRSSELAHHSGQVAFPGGGLDADEDAASAALREAIEEVGLRIESAEVVLELPPLWLPVSENLVTPVVAWWHTPHELYVGDPREVDLVRRVSLEQLADPVNRVRVRHSSGRLFPAFLIDELVVWGFTGGIIDALLQLLALERDWDRSRVVEL